MKIRKTFRGSAALVLVPLFSQVFAEASAAEKVNPFFLSHCVVCHSGDDPQSGLNLETLSHDLTDVRVFDRWTRIFDRVSQGDMPPKSEDQPFSR